MSHDSGSADIKSFLSCLYFVLSYINVFPFRIQNVDVVRMSNAQGSLGYFAPILHAIFHDHPASVASRLNMLNCWQ